MDGHWRETILSRFRRSWSGSSTIGQATLGSRRMCYYLPRWSSPDLQRKSRLRKGIKFKINRFALLTENLPLMGSVTTRSAMEDLVRGNMSVLGARRTRSKATEIKCLSAQARLLLPSDSLAQDRIGSFLFLEDRLNCKFNLILQILVFL